MTCNTSAGLSVRSPFGTVLDGVSRSTQYPEQRISVYLQEIARFPNPITFRGIRVAFGKPSMTSMCRGEGNHISTIPRSIALPTLNLAVRSDSSCKRKVLPMKMLFSLKNMLASKKSLKEYAWYLWY
jgi:hypothetical protein